MSDSPGGRENSAEQVSQNQAENLLKAMKSMDQGCRHADAAGTAPEIDADLLGWVRRLHESVSQQLSSTLNSILRTAVEVRVEDASTFLLDSFYHQAQDYRWLSVLSPETTVGDWHFDIDPDLCCVMVDRMLGGDPAEGETFERPMTDIELRLMGHVVDATLATIEQMWQQIAEIRWIVRHNEMSTRFSGVEPEAMVLIQFAVTLCNNHGNIRLCIPLRTIEGLRTQLSDQSWTSGSATRERVFRNVAGAPIDVIANVAHSTIRSGDLLDLNVGDIIATEKAVDEPLELTIHNLPKFRICAGSLKGNKAIQIEAPVDPPAANRQSSSDVVVPIKEDR